MISLLAAAIWISSWAAAPSDQAGVLAVPAPSAIADETFRTVVRLSAGGTALRLRLSNELGDRPLLIDDVRVGNHAIYFLGHTSTTIAAGAAIVSDALSMPTEGLAELAVSIHVPGPMPRLTAHVFGQNTTWISSTKELLPSAIPTSIRYIIRGVDVSVSSRTAQTIVALGDSITDGEQSSFDSNHRWPDRLAERLQRMGRKDVGVANMGISGNQLLRPGWGLSALARLDRDVFSLPNVGTLLLLEGINDLGMPIYAGGPMPTTSELTAAYTQIVTRAHEHGIKVIGATLMPYKASGADYYSVAGDQVRVEVNEWMRHSNVFDRLVDLDRLTADPEDKALLAHAFDSGDGVHPPDSGYAALADAFATAISAVEGTGKTDR